MKSAALVIAVKNVPDRDIALALAEAALKLVEQALDNDNFEAALKFNDGSSTKYYPGGVRRVFDTADEVLRIFQCLAWMTGAGGRMSGFYPRSGDLFLDWWQPFSIASTNPVAEIGWPAFVDIDDNGRTDVIVPLDREGLFNDQFAIFAR